MTEITDEQRAAWQRIEQGMGEVENPEVDRADWSLIAPLLPSELTNPQPVLPTEPGTVLREDETGNVWCRKLTHWVSVDGGNAEPEAPFTRLVPERPQITREQVIAVFDSYGDNYDVETVNDLVELANGTDRD
jgi:hypothetical protein